LCPYPWRVPTQQDFSDLDIALGGDGGNRNATETATSTPQFVTDNYITRWGGHFGGSVQPTLIYQNQWGAYWSQTHTSTYPTAFALQFYIGGHVYPLSRSVMYAGMALRCVRDTAPLLPESALILDVTLENLTDGLVDRSPAQQTFVGGTSGVSVYPEGGLRLNRWTGNTPKWTINRLMENLRIEFDVKLLSRPHAHGTVLSFARDPEQDHGPRISLTIHGQDQAQWFFNDMWRTPSVPLNAWTRIRVDIGERVDGRVDIRVYFNDVLQHSGNSNMVAGAIATDYSNYVFPHISIGQDFGFANHDRADAAIRNLRVWLIEP